MRHVSIPFPLNTRPRLHRIEFPALPISNQPRQKSHTDSTITKNTQAHAHIHKNQLEPSDIRLEKRAKVTTAWKLGSSPMARPFVLRKGRQLPGRRRKPSRKNKHNRSRKGEGPIGVQSKEVMARRKRGAKLFASLCAEKLGEGLTDGATCSLRMAVRCGSPRMDAEIFGVTTVRSPDKLVQGRMASFLNGSVALAASIPLPSGERCGTRWLPEWNPACVNPCKRRAVEAVEEGCASGKRRMTTSNFGGFCASVNRDGVLPVNSCVEQQGRESAAAGDIEGGMNVDSGPSGAGEPGNCDRMCVDRVGFEDVGTSCGGLMHSSGKHAAAAAAGFMGNGGGHATVPVIEPVGSTGDSGTELHDSMCLEIRDNPAVPLSSSSGGEPECSEAGKEALARHDCQTENPKKCIDVWLDSLPDMLPGALLSPDDAYDNSPPPSPPQYQEESICAVPATNPTPETSMQQQSSMVPQHFTERKPIVFLWDLDETLILSTSLSTGQYAQCNEDLDAKKLAELGVNWSKASSYIAEKHLFSKQIRNGDQITLQDVQCYDDGRNLSDYDFTSDLTSDWLDGTEGKRKLAYRYRKITEFYEMGLENTSVSKYVPFWQDLWKRTDSYCNAWLSSVHKLLETTQTTGRDVVHIIVTAGSLVPSLTKIMLFQLDKYFPAHHVYSSQPLPDGKFDVFRQVRERFGPNCAYCAIGDGPYEELAAAENGWAFVRIGLANGALPTVGTSGGLDAIGRYASTPMEISTQDLIKAADAETATRARDDVPLRFRESTRKQTMRAEAAKLVK